MQHFSALICNPSIHCVVNDEMTFCCCFILTTKNRVFDVCTSQSVLGMVAGFQLCFSLQILIADDGKGRVQKKKQKHFFQLCHLDDFKINGNVLERSVKQKGTKTDSGECHPPANTHVHLPNAFGTITLSCHTSIKFMDHFWFRKKVLVNAFFKDQFR